MNEIQNELQIIKLAELKLSTSYSNVFEEMILICTIHPEYVQEYSKLSYFKEPNMDLVQAVSHYHFLYRKLNRSGLIFEDDEENNIFSIMNDMIGNTIFGVVVTYYFKNHEGEDIMKEFSVKLALEILKSYAKLLLEIQDNIGIHNSEMDTIDNYIDSLERLVKANNL